MSKVLLKCRICSRSIQYTLQLHTSINIFYTFLVFIPNVCAISQRALIILLLHSVSQSTYETIHLTIFLQTLTGCEMTQYSTKHKILRFSNCYISYDLRVFRWGMNSVIFKSINSKNVHAFFLWRCSNPI